MNHLFRRVVIGIVSLAFAFGISQKVTTAAELDFPKKDKVITIIVPYNAGGSTDTEGRVIAALLEKKLGIPVQISNKPGARTMVGMTELVMAKPDGHTLLLASAPTFLVPLVDEKSQAAYTRKDFKAVAVTTSDPFCFAVAGNSPYNSLKDVVDFAKANPEKFRVAVTALLAAPHLSVLELGKQTGGVFAPVNFDGAAPSRTSFLGGHTEGIVFTVSEASQVAKGGLARILGIMDEAGDPHLPGIPTMQSQGYNIMVTSNTTLVAPGKTPPEIINKLEKLLKEVYDDPEYDNKIKQLGFTKRFKGVKESEQFLDDLMKQYKPLVEDVRKKQG